MWQYVALVTGTTVVEITALPYALVSYGMIVAPLNDNELGPLYADVEEPLTFHATGCTPAEAMANVAIINTLLDQARRWWQGEPVDAVLLRVQAQNATLALDVAVLGRASGGPPAVAMQPTWDETIGRYIIRDVEIQFQRHGQFLSTTTESGVSTTATNPTVQAITISSVVTRSSPIKLEAMFRFGGVNTLGGMYRGVILTASAANRMQIYEAESGTLGTNVASVADAANLARGGAVARYSPGVLASAISIAITPAFDPAAKRFAFWAAVRNNSATTTFTIQVFALNQATAATPITPIDTSTIDPRIVFLGMASIQDFDNGLGVVGMSFATIRLTASAASGTLDIDYIVIQAVDDETSAALMTATIADSLGAISASGGGIPTTVDHQLLTKPGALVKINNGSTIPALSYAGDPVLYSRGPFVACYLGTFGPAWRISSGANVNDIIWTATRSPAYLIPE